MSKRPYFIWRRKPIKNCDPEQLMACLKFCWDAISSRKRKIIKRKLIKLTIFAAKEKYKQIENNETPHQTTTVR